MTGDHELEREALIQRLLDSVKKCQVAYGDKKNSLATEKDSCVSCLVEHFEQVLLHGLKRANVWEKLPRIAEPLRQVTQKMLPETEITFWSLLKDYLNHLDVQHFLSLEGITTDAGRGRVWLRTALNETTLESHLNSILEHATLTSQWYESWALMMDVERASTLPTMARGLGSIFFAIDTRNPELNKPFSSVWTSIDAKTHRRIKSNPLPVMAERLDDIETSSLRSSRGKNRKKKKVNEARIADLEEIPSTMSATDLSPGRSESSGTEMSRSSSADIFSSVGDNTWQHDSSIDFNNSNTRMDFSKGNELHSELISFPTLDMVTNIVDQMMGEDGGGGGGSSSYVPDYDNECLYQQLESLNIPTNEAHGVVEADTTLFAESSSTVVSESLRTSSENNTQTERDRTRAETLIPLIGSDRTLTHTREEKSGGNTNQDRTYSTCSIVGPVASASECDQSFQVLTTSPDVSLDVYKISDMTKLHDETHRLEKDSYEGQLGFFGPCPTTEVYSSLSDFTTFPDLEEINIKSSVTCKEEEGEDNEAFLHNISIMAVQNDLDHGLREDVDETFTGMGLPDWNSLNEMDDCTRVRVGSDGSKYDPMVAFDKESSQAASDAALVTQISRTDPVLQLDGEDLVLSALLPPVDMEKYIPKIVPQPSHNTADDLTKDELKKVILANAKVKEDLEISKRSLELAYQEQQEELSALRKEQERIVSEFEQREVNKVNMLQELTKENELLKKQLKMYAELSPRREAEGCGEGPVFTSEENQSLEGKLLQMSEMHSDVLELQENLHRQLILKNNEIAMMRNQLVQLRGPLPDHALNASSESLESLYTPQAKLVNIWIPSVFKKSKSPESHHIYQVYIRIGCEEWNIYRRYSQFDKLHAEVSKVYPTLEDAVFPKKKYVKLLHDAKLVEKRRLQLQDYLRNLINTLIEQGAILPSDVSKKKLTQLYPFFSEEGAVESSKTKPGKGQRSDSTTVYNGL